VLPPLEAIIRKCVRKDPEERYQDAGELLHDLQHWQDLDLTGFVFEAETAVVQPSEKGLYLIIAALSVGFLAAAAAATYLYYLLSHAGH
jgi:serine/threonine protein kinase